VAELAVDRAAEASGRGSALPSDLRHLFAGLLPWARVSVVDLVSQLRPRADDDAQHIRPSSQSAARLSSTKQVEQPARRRERWTPSLRGFTPASATFCDLQAVHEQNVARVRAYSASIPHVDYAAA
jgi:hypothetical protein